MSISINVSNMMPGFGKPGLKSTKEKLERQQKCGNQIEFLENQKAALKEMTGDSLEEIRRKLEMFYTYENQIVAVKAQYNNEQMWHVMDEAKELGEKIAEAVEDNKPKTAEERKEEIKEEIKEKIFGPDGEEDLPTDSIPSEEELLEWAELLHDGSEQIQDVAKQLNVSEVIEELTEVKPDQKEIGEHFNVEYKPFDSLA